MTQDWINVRVSQKRLEAEDICSIELVDLNGASLLPFTAGSHIDIEVAPDLVRQYSLCTNPNDLTRYLIGVLREPASRGGSIKMIDEIKVGDQLRISSPKNRFPLEPSAQRTLLIAGGIGITPILCMAERLSNARQIFTLHYSARSKIRMAFYDRIKTSPFAENVAFHFDDGLEDQRLQLETVLREPQIDDHAYVCGPSGLIEAVLRIAKAQGWADHQVHREFFTPPADSRPDSLFDDAFEVHVASSGQVINIPAGQSITSVLADHGLRIPVSCEQGVCGTCLTRVLDGAPDHRDNYMTDEEKDKNDQMLPCCSRAKTQRLVLDL